MAAVNVADCWGYSFFLFSEKLHNRIQEVRNEENLQSSGDFSWSFETCYIEFWKKDILQVLF
jgi:hypothetical protein